MQITIDTTKKEFILNQPISIKELNQIVEQYGLEEFKLVPRVKYTNGITYDPIYNPTPGTWSPISAGITYTDGDPTTTYNTDETIRSNTSEEASWQIN